MYRLLRNTHLLLGLFCCLTLLMYGASSVQMSHNTWFRLQPVVTNSDYQVTPELADGRAVAEELMRRYGLKGDLGPVRAANLGLAFNITRPGTVYQVQYAAANGSAAVRENHAGFMGMLNRIHHVAGLTHTYWLINAWGTLVAFVSLSMLVLGATGVYMWFKIHQERVAGSILFGSSLVFSLTLIVMLRAAW